MAVIRNYVNVEDVQYGDGVAEVLDITMRISKRERRKIIVAYVPPKTNAWKYEEHKVMQKEMMKCLENVITICNKVLLLGDFNCKNVNWEVMGTCGNAETWSEEVIQMAAQNTMEQWVDEFTRYRGTEEPSMLDLVLTKRPEQRPTINYLSPMGKSDRVVIEVELRDEMAETRKEDHKNGRLNYAKANFVGLRKFFWKYRLKETYGRNDSSRKI